MVSFIPWDGIPIKSPTQQTQASWWVERKWEAVMIQIFRYDSVIASLFQSSLRENEEKFPREISVPTGFFLLHGSYGFYENYHN